MAVKLVPNPLNGVLLSRTPLMEAFLRSKAEDVAKTAQELAPVGDPSVDPHSGEYRDRIKGEAGLDKGKMVGRVNAYDYKSAWIEFGTVYVPAHATLRKACDAHHLSLTGGRK